MKKTKTSILNAIAALIQMLVTGLVGLVINKTIISIYGSDYNGINSTISQIVSTLMILEGGFSLASNVALFEPFGKKNFESVNGILVATKNRFLLAGGISFIVGLIITLIYPFTVSSVMPKWLIMALMLTALIPVSYNLAFNMKYRVMILTDQKEYVISLLTAITYLFGNAIAFLLMKNGFSILFARLSIMFMMIINYWIIAIYCKRKYPFIKLTNLPNYEAIKGTKSVIILKITSVLYFSLPIIAISTIPEVGPLLASVYAVYKGILAVVRDSLTSVINAPRLSFGALLSEGRREKIKSIFNQYETMSYIGISTILGTTCLLLLPFVVLYTKGVQDVQYKDTYLAIMMLSTVFLEVLAIPSGQIIQMKGEFSVSTRIQAIAFIILMICMTIGGLLWGLYGIASSVFVAALSLSIMQIYYVNSNIFKRPILDVLKNILPCLLICGIALFVGLEDIIVINNYLSFIIIGFISVICFGLLSLSLYLMANKNAVKELFLTIKTSLLRK